MTLQDQIYFSLLPLTIVNMFIITMFTYYGVTWPRRKVSKETMDRMHSSFLGVYFREFWAWFTNPVIKLFILLRMTPNMVTALSIVLSGIAGYFFAIGEIGWGGWGLIISGSMDTFDGRLARETNQETRSGAYFDACMDRYSDSFIFMGILLYFNSTAFKGSLSPERQWISLAMVLVCFLMMLGTEVISYSKAKGEAMGFSTNRGLMQRPERVAFLSIFTALFPLFKVVLEQYGIHRDTELIAAVVLMMVLVQFSAISRIWNIFNSIKKTEPSK